MIKKNIFFKHFFHQKNIKIFSRGFAEKSCQNHYFLGGLEIGLKHKNILNQLFIVDALVNKLTLSRIISI
jgi:hypothetical protein